MGKCGTNKENKVRLNSIFLILIGVFCYAQDAHAYLDPGTGSLILQTLVALFLGAVFTAKLWWFRLKTFLSRIFSKKKREIDDQK